MARILAISSQVVRGHVGLAADVPALQSLGHEVWALPTVLLASRPGLGRLQRYELPQPDLAAMLEALEADGCWPTLDAVFTGYFPSPGSVQVAAEAIARVKAANPRVLVCVDPILGDAGRLYVAQETAEAIRDRLIPLADIATPNLFELTWLTRPARRKPGGGRASGLQAGAADGRGHLRIAHGCRCRNAAGGARRHLGAAKPHAQRHSQWRRRCAGRAVPRPPSQA